MALKLPPPGTVADLQHAAFVAEADGHTEWANLFTEAAEEMKRLRRALEFYRGATLADWNNDNGFNADAALAYGEMK